MGISRARWEARKRFGQEPKKRDPVAYREYQRRYQAARRAKFDAAGLCVDCGCARDSVWKRCTYCAAMQLVRVERSQFRLKEGLR